MENFLNLSNYSLTSFSAAIIVINILVAFALSLVISWVYLKTHRNISYSQSFTMAMIMMAVLAAVAMMILSNNLVRALGVLGIFSLIRFRTIIKDTKDVAYLFFVLATGMAVGTNNYVIAVICTILLSLIILALSKFNFGSVVREGYLLTFIADNNFEINSYEDLFKQYTVSYKLLQIKTRGDGEQEYYFSIHFGKNDEHRTEFINKLKSLPGVKMAELITGRDSSEY